MANILTHAARHAKAELLAAGIEVGHAKLQEVMAALLGYHTYRALKHEEDDQELERHLTDAEFIVAPGAKQRKINVLLTHVKAGRSGLVLKDVDPVEDITAVLDLTCVDQLVQRNDGSAVRPWVAIVVHTPSGTVLGSAISLADDRGLLEVDALADALSSTVLLGTDESSKCLPYHISKLQTDGSIRSNELFQMALVAGIEVTYHTRPLMGRGSVERISQKIATLGMNMSR